MSLTNWFCLIFATVLILSSCELSQIRHEFLLSLSNHLIVKHCIFVSDGDIRYMQISKFFSLSFITTSFLSSNSLNSYIMNYPGWFQSRPLILVEEKVVDIVLSSVFTVNPLLHSTNKYFNAN